MKQQAHVLPDHKIEETDLSTDLCGIRLENPFLLSSHFDAREYGLITTVKDQGDYGSCWALGIMHTGWLLDQGKWYYLAPGNGDMQTGLITESGYQYYLSPADGHMLTGTMQVPAPQDREVYQIFIIFCEPNCLLLRPINDGTNREQRRTI